MNIKIKSQRLYNSEILNGWGGTRGTRPMAICFASLGYFVTMFKLFHFLNRQLCISDKCWRASWRCKFYRWPRNTIWTDSDNWRVSWSSAFRSLVRSREVRNPRLPATCCCTPCRPYPMIPWLDPDCRNQVTLPNKSNPHDRAVWYWPLPEWSSYRRFLFIFQMKIVFF